MSAQVRVRVRVRVRVQVRLTLTLTKWTACQAALVRVTVEAERDGHALRIAGRVRRREALGLGEEEQGVAGTTTLPKRQRGPCTPPPQSRKKVLDTLTSVPPEGGPPDGRTWLVLGLGLG